MDMSLLDAGWVVVLSLLTCGLITSYLERKPSLNKRIGRIK